MHPIHQQTPRGSTQPIPRPNKNSDLKTDIKREAAPHKKLITEVAAAREREERSECNKNANRVGSYL
jgi:hypothetical protein